MSAFHAPPPIDYRGITIKFDVDKKPQEVVGRADLFKGDEFAERITIRSPKAAPEELCARLRLLAKAKVDVRSLASRWAGSP